MVGIPIEMPKGCEDCPCFHDAACYVELWRRTTTLDWIERKEKREEWCQLIDLSGDGKSANNKQTISKHFAKRVSLMETSKQLRSNFVATS